MSGENGFIVKTLERKKKNRWRWTTNAAANLKRLTLRKQTNIQWGARICYRIFYYNIVFNYKKKKMILDRKVYLVNEICKAYKNRKKIAKKSDSNIDARNVSWKQFLIRNEKISFRIQYFSFFFSKKNLIIPNIYYKNRCFFSFPVTFISHRNWKWFLRLCSKCICQIWKYCKYTNTI